MGGEGGGSTEVDRKTTEIPSEFRGQVELKAADFSKV